MFWIKRCVHAADRLARGMTREFGTWAPVTAGAFGTAWWFTGCSGEVMALGFVTVPIVRMTVDRRIEQRWNAPETPQARAVAPVGARRD